MRGNTSRCQCGPSWSHAFSGTSASPRMRCSRRTSSASRRSAGASRSLSSPLASGREGAISSSYGTRLATGQPAVTPSRTTHLEHGREPALGGDRRRRGRQPGELRVRVRQRRAGLVPFVEDREAVAAFGPRPPLPRLGDEIDRRVVESAERTHVRRAVDHDLLPLERGIEVRHDPDLPAGRTVTEPQRLRRCPILVAGAERARGGVVVGAAGRPRPLRPPRGDRHPATGRRIVAEVGQRRAWSGLGLVAEGRERPQHLDRDRERDRRRRRRAELEQRLQVAQLQRDRVRPRSPCAASFSRSEAWNSPSALITFARRSRSASAWRAIARCMPCGISTSFTSTIETLMPHGAVCSSMIPCRIALIFSRSESSSSS